MLYICPNCGKWIKTREIPDRCPACRTFLSGKWPFSCMKEKITWWLYFGLVALATFFPSVYAALFTAGKINEVTFAYLYLSLILESYLWVNIFQSRFFLYKLLPGETAYTFGNWEYILRDACTSSIFSFLFFTVFDIIGILFVLGNRINDEQPAQLLVHLPNISCYVLSLIGIWFPHVTRFDITYAAVVFPMENKHPLRPWSILYWLPLSAVVYFIARNIITFL